MKYIILLNILFPVIAFGANCDGALGGHHYNEDGTIGGFVARTAWVDNFSYLDSTSEVCGKAKVSGKAVIKNHSHISEEVVINGSVSIDKSLIYGAAKLSGQSVVSDSRICQNSVVAGINVIKSDYYCQTEDPAPKDPEEIGRKTLLGIDTDGDGVRDDVEVMINNLLSNTELKNRSEERIATKLYASLLQKQIINQKNESLIKIFEQEKVDILDCFDLSIINEVFTKMHNTRERLFSLFKVGGYSDGKKVYIATKKCKSVVDYRIFLSKF